MNLFETRCILCKHLLPLGAQEVLSNTAKDLLHDSQNTRGEIISNIISSIDSSLLAQATKKIW